MYFPDFQKDVREFSRITQSMTASDPASVLKLSKKLEKNTSSLLSYLLQGEKAPPVSVNDKSVENLVALIRPIKQGLLDYEGKRLIIDAPNYVALLKNLETLKLISHSLRK